MYDMCAASSFRDHADELRLLAEGWRLNRTAAIRRFAASDARDGP